MEEKNYMKLLVEMTNSENEEQAFNAIENLLKSLSVVAIKDKKLLYASGLQVALWNAIMNDISRMINEAVV
jgi:hypothetical protein